MYTFDAAMGQSCGRGGRQSGLCDPVETSNRHLLHGCRWQAVPVVNPLEPICGVNLAGLGRTGEGLERVQLPEWDLYSIPGGHAEDYQVSVLTCAAVTRTVLRAPCVGRS